MDIGILVLDRILERRKQMSPEFNRFERQIGERRARGQSERAAARDNRIR